MKKLKLDLKDLKVESFELNPSKGVKKGTIKGNEEPTVAGDTCIEPSCAGTCFENTCPNTCVNTCPNTCGVDPTCDYPTCFNTAACGGGNTCDYTCGSTCAGYTCDRPEFCP